MISGRRMERGMEFAMRRKLLIVLFMFFLTNMAGSHASDTTTVTEAEVLILLRGYEWELDVEALKSLPGGAEDVLLDIARNGEHPDYIKSRAVVALAQFPGDRVWTFLAGELTNAAPIVRRRLIDIICQTFSADRPAQVEAMISDYLTQPDAHLRVTVARCLQSIGSVSAIEAIQRYQKATGGTAESWERNALNR